MKKTADIGLIGLAVMGENLALNMESRGYTVAVYNRTTSRTTDFLANRGMGKNFITGGSLEDFVRTIERPRKIMLMIKAGEAVDSFIERLLPIIEEGDIIIDGGNSFHQDTDRRVGLLESKGLLYVGTGISGGEEGALHGPSIMPGGSTDAWEHIKPIFQSIAAKAEDGSPCCDWIGEGGAGHFVKMVHNGIEYGDMQLICEAYHILKALLQMSAAEMRDVFTAWNQGALNSYLIKITSAIFSFKDTDGEPLLDRILDTAGQKGTGKWTSVTALDLGVPLTLISEAVFSRFLSALKDQRTAASRKITGPAPSYAGDKIDLVAKLENALLASKIMSYAQGFALMKAASEHYGWQLDLSCVALIWRAGCIIRSALLDYIARAFDDEPGLDNLMLDDYFGEKINRAQAGWRKTVSESVMNGIPVPAM
ncbi:MAG: decarboxylating NADP(+)-dependent phosphogluconate dehydrogenase, partial [Deltaproteobacteria bacterium]|nr:decarboxylating NADP(+)-dependent phosphogluconate dehydrogenase [Deltaproteobacteria bacterium]